MLFVISLLTAQNQIINFDGESRNIENTEPYRTVYDEGVYGVQVIYQFPGAEVVPQLKDNQVFQKLYIKNFSHSQEVGKASLPSHIDIFIVPNGSVPSIQLLTVDTSTLNNFLVYPALKPASDEYGASDPDFIVDSAFYNLGVMYPNSPVILRELIEYKGVQLALVEVFPIQYLPSSRKLFVHSEIAYKLNFTTATGFLQNPNLSKSALVNLTNYVLNNQVFGNEVQQFINSTNLSSNDPDYLIITHPDFLAAADSLAEWKRKMGFNPEIITSSSWTSSGIKNAISLRYTNYSPSPDYFVLLGDNDKVPGQTIISGATSFATDLYYSTMDGSTDFVPDLAYGRISVTSSAQALMVVKKIINYEKNPPLDTSFYSSGLNCAYFQHAGSGYADRRFAQTSEEIRNHIVSRGYDVDRVYYTENTVTPLYWNNGYYSAGEPIPNYLLKPGFAWDGNASDINTAINEGRFYIFHRDHGMSSGWGDPYYTTSNVNLLTNGNKLPIVFSINCLTGKYMDAECFAEKFLRIANGGAVGVFGHGEVSYSGYNDGLALGLVDAIWSNPGLVPTFSGSGGVNNPTLTPHTDIFRMGDVKNQGLIRMIETWGGNTTDIQYTHELLNYFGDPAMPIYTSFPSPIFAFSDDTLDCHNDTILYISNCNYDGIATLVSDDELLCKANIINGNATLTFSPLNGTKVYLTISAHNHKPYTKEIIISGGCPKAKFTAQSNKFCLSDSVLITNYSSGNIAAYQWNFGLNAVPSVANGIGPFYVKYLSPGNKIVTLTITDSSNNSISVQKDFIIDQYCRYNVPSTGAETVTSCSGMLYDDGGLGNYSDNTFGSFTISPLGASSITLTFSSFDFETGYDYLKIYDGPNNTSSLIGSYTGSLLPNGGVIASASGSITIEQSSDSYLNQGGFVLNWQCNYPSSSPQTNFKVADSLSCDGVVQFNDYSTNGPSNWLWDFGDGTTSTQQNPQHIYSSNGTFNVKLFTSNVYGSDSMVSISAVTVNMPSSPTVIDGMRCKAGSVDLTSGYNGNGTLWWFNSPTALLPVDTGKIYTTPNLATSTVYYAEVHEKKAPLMTGKTDNSGGGAYFTSATVHYLVFDCYKPVKLKSVLVYASTGGIRTIQLLNSGGSLIKSKNVNIPAGASRIELDFDLPVGINLRLAGPVSPNLYRNNGGTNYPYDIPNVISIKHSSASTNPTGYYYYFYDWEIIEGECVSPRVQVNALILDTLAPVCDFIFTNNDPSVSFVNSGDYGSSYYWDFGDGDFSFAENPTHLFQSNGVFNVKLIATNNCGQRTSTRQVTILSAGLQTTSVFEKIAIYPVPANKLLNVDYELQKSQNLGVRVADITGRQVIVENWPAISGQNSNKLDVSKLAQGLYTLTLKCSDGYIIRKFIIE